MKLTFWLIIAPAIGIWLVYSYLDGNSAALVFDSEKVGDYTVVASKRWHWGVFGCTYAVVELEDSLEPALNSETLTGLAYPNRKGLPYWPTTEAWRRTPIESGNWNPEAYNFKVRPVNEGMTGYFHHCLLDFDSGTRDKILKSMEKPGSWYAVSFENVAFVIPEQRILGTIRYGD